MVVTGETRVPGDKSVTHRALFLAAMAPGTSRLAGALTSLDSRSTARVLRALGVAVGALRIGRNTVVRGQRSWTPPNTVLHCGNSGTTARLGLGILAAQQFSATLTGDASLRRRPMRRVTEPLVQMGASVVFRGEDGLPLTIHGGPLRAIRWELPVSSAQLKSAVLLAGLAAGVEVGVWEPGGRSRDHTERMLKALGCHLDVSRDGWITLRPGVVLAPFSMRIPGDLSSAAFLVGAATLACAGELVIREVGLNPTRSGFLDVVERMGGVVERLESATWMGEPVGDLVVRPAGLRATRVTASEIPGLIDEIPMLAVLASRAEGTTVFDQVGELRVKESDRLALLAANLTALGTEAHASENRLTVVGTDRPPRGRVRTEGDHRLAMAFAVLGTVTGARVEVDDPGAADVSFPGFFETLESIGARR